MLNIHETLLKNMSGTMDPGRRDYLPREQAYEQLKELTSQDFSYDLDKWLTWLNEQKGRTINGVTVLHVQKVW